MTFADIGDRLFLEATAGPNLTIDGPFANGLGAGADNLVVRARDVVLKTVSATAAASSAFHLRLTKNLPLASGIGGGSADAAAAIRLLAARLGVDVSTLSEVASSLGSDVPACLESRPVTATGRGDILQAPPSFPQLHAVLVNPGVASPTAEVYHAYDSAPSPRGADCPWPKAKLESARDVVRFLADCRNDLEDPAVRLKPRIGDVLAFLRGRPESLLARMSGSGATCFALVEDANAADSLVSRIAERESHWWVMRTILEGAP